MPNLSDYNLDLNEVQENPAEAIRKVLEAYNKTVKSYRDSSEKSTTGVKQAVSLVQSGEEYEETVERSDALLDTLRSDIYRVLSVDPAVSILLFDALQEIKDGVAAFRSEAMKGITLDAEEEEEEGNGVDFEEVEYLHKALGNFVNFATMSGLSVSDMPAAVTHRNKKTGKLEVKLPRKPNAPETKEGDSVKGRHASVYKMEYSILVSNEQGEQEEQTIPKGTSLNRIALFYCSTPDTWINGSDLMDTVKRETGKEWGAGSWEVQVPAGILRAVKKES